jgi:hypothetical protein
MHADTDDNTARADNIEWQQQNAHGNTDGSSGGGGMLVAATGCVIANELDKKRATQLLSSILKNSRRYIELIHMQRDGTLQYCIHIMLYYIILIAYLLG